MLEDLKLDLLFRPVSRIYRFIQNGSIVVPEGGLNIIDIGFGNIAGYFLLEHKGLLKSFIGVNQISEDEVTVSRLDPDRSTSWRKDFGIPTETIRGDIYEKYLEFNKGHDSASLSLSKDDFEVKYKFIFEKKLEHFIEDDIIDTNCDLLILSNILHFVDFKVTSDVLKIGKKLLGNRGKIYIQLLTEAYTFSENSNKFSEPTLNQMEELLLIESKTTLIPGQIEYLGQIK